MPKKEFSSVDVAVVTQELLNLVPNSRVNNVYQLDPKTLLLKLHKTGMPPLRLVLEAGRRLHLTSYSLEKPLVPPAFCMALRKHLRNAWLTKVEQHEFERIAIFSFKTKTGIVRLVLELFGEGNLILCDEKGEILQALIFKRMRDRNILRNETFKFPPSSGKNPFKVTREELEKILKDSGDAEVVRVIARSLGVGGVYAEEILLRTEIEKTKHCSMLSNAEIDAIFDVLQRLLSLISNSKVDPRIVLDENGNFLDVVPFNLERYAAFKFQPFQSFNLALDEFYLRVTVTEKAFATAEIDKLKREAQRLKRIVTEQEQLLSEADGKAELDKHIGNVIYAHSGELQTLMDWFWAAKGLGKEWAGLVSEVLTAKSSGKMPEALFDSFDAHNLAINVEIGSLKFSLSLRKTLFENAAEFYERGKKTKQKSAGALTALEESRKKLSEAETRISEAEITASVKPLETMDELVKRKVEVESKEWYEKFRWFNSTEGFLVVAGKDAVSNEVLVKKHAEPADIVFHAEIIGAPFVVVKTGGKDPGEQTLREAGEFAVSFSRAWRENMGSADVYWVNPDQLNKSGPSGESVPHGGFMVVGKRNWMRNVPLRLSIGIMTNDEVKFVGGPVEAVKAKTKTFAVIGPGDAKGKELLKQILRALTSKLSKERRETIGKTSVEQIRDFVPYTKGRLIETPS